MLPIGPGPAQILVAHQMLNGLATTSRDDVHWGNLMTNNLRVLELAAVLDARADPLCGSYLHYLGDVTRGAGDPAGVAVSPGGRIAVSLGGVDEVALGPDPNSGWTRLAVGRRPTVVAISPDGRLAYVANTFADSISVVDLKSRKVRGEIVLGPQPIRSPRDRGEALFYNAHLSHDGWFSCHSCHTDGHTNGRLNDNLTDGSFGTPKRILSLLGVRDTGPWAWNGSMPTLEDQIRKSVQTTMDGAPLSAEQVGDLAAYLRTLPPPPAPGPGDEAAVRRGRAVFAKQACARCHTPPVYTSPHSYDVGLADEAGNRRFNPPSLRGLGQGGPFFHDGRAATLEDVFRRYRHQLRDELSDRELADLLAFLLSL